MIVVVPVHLKILGGTNQRISTHTFVKLYRGCLEEMVQDEGGAREPKNSVEYVVEDVNVHTNVIVNERKKGKQEKGKDRGKIHKDMRDIREKERRRERGRNSDDNER